MGSKKRGKEVTDRQTASLLKLGTIHLLTKETRIDDK
jgi:hypothetical protein